jgi:hypothetical protein
MMWFLVKTEAEEFYTKYVPRHSIFETHVTVKRRKVSNVQTMNAPYSLKCSSCKGDRLETCVIELWYISN